MSLLETACESRALDARTDQTPPPISFVEKIPPVKVGKAGVVARAVLASGMILNSLNPSPSIPNQEGYDAIYGAMGAPGAGFNLEGLPSFLKQRVDKGNYGAFYYGHRAYYSSSSDITDWYRGETRQATTDRIGKRTTEVYTKRDDALIEDDLTQMQNGNLDFAISSWDSQDDARDQFMQHMKALYQSPDWQHQDFSWSFIYEKEGFGDPSKESIMEDLKYLQREYFNQPWFLKHDGKPVLFVYSSESDKGKYLQKWAEIQDEMNREAEENPSDTNTGLHVVLKSYRGYDIPLQLPDFDRLDLLFPPRAEVNPYFEYVDQVDWYDYQPVNRIIVNRNSIIISPAYSRKGDLRVLPYNQKAWLEAVFRMVSSDAVWKLTFFNEVYEQTGVKPTLIFDTKMCSPDGKAPKDSSRLDMLIIMVPPNPSYQKVSSPPQQPEQAHILLIPFKKAS